ncbi:hypothetical protein L7F22_018924 [Adiantum nelumboides]|nr:hypothetical protein [Adiantum nelumboides]
MAGNAYVAYKRFRMSGQESKMIDGKPIEKIDRWGFNLAEESHLKSFRSSWRDDKCSVTIMDRSYDAWLRVSAIERRSDSTASNSITTALLNILREAGFEVEWKDDTNTTYDQRAFESILCIAVGKEDEENGEDIANEVEESPLNSIRRAIAKVQIIWPPTSYAPKKREVLIRTHPASISKVEKAIRHAIVPGLQSINAKVQIDLVRLNNIPHPNISAGSGAKGRRHGKDLEKKKKAKSVEMNEIGRPSGKLLIEQLTQNLLREWRRKQAYNIFEISGPSSDKLISKVLVPTDDHNGQGYLGSRLRSGKGLDGEIISLEVHDPRLSFPPREGKKSKKKATIPSAQLGQNLFLEGYSTPTYSSGEIHSRRAALPVPGSRLKPTTKDDIIPVILIRNRLSSHQSNWTVILPRGWGKAFWLSFVQPGTRVLGQKQLHALQFDKGKPTFPCDWVTTPAFKRWAESESQYEFDIWQRTPPAKRINFDHNRIRWPFGGESLWLEVVRNGMIYSIGKNSEHIKNPAKRPPWLFANGKQSNTLPDLIKVYGLWIEREKPVISTLPFVPLILGLRRALLVVHLTACRRGAFERWDEIHAMSYEQSERWKSALQATQEDKYQREQLQKLEQKGIKDSNNHIGSITTGQFALSNGKDIPCEKCNWKSKLQNMPPYIKRIKELAAKSPPRYCSNTRPSSKRSLEEEEEGGLQIKGIGNLSSSTSPPLRPPDPRKRQKSVHAEDTEEISQTDTITPAEEAINKPVIHPSTQDVIMLEENVQGDDKLEEELVKDKVEPIDEIYIRSKLLSELKCVLKRKEEEKRDFLANEEEALSINEEEAEQLLAKEEEMRTICDELINGREELKEGLKRK